MARQTVKNIEPFDDGSKPLNKRPGVPVSEPEEVIGLTAGGHLAISRQKAHLSSQNFILLRGPLGALKLSYSHAHIVKIVWRLWAKKRVQGVEDPGVSVAEVAEVCEADTRPYYILSSLVRSRVLRSVTTSTGWQGLRVVFYPTQAAIQMLAFSEILPIGSMVQIGKTSRVWKARGADIPPDLFQHAALLRGGIARGVTH